MNAFVLHLKYDKEDSLEKVLNMIHYIKENKSNTRESVSFTMIVWHSWFQKNEAYVPHLSLPIRPKQHCPGRTTMWSPFNRQRIPAGFIPHFFQPPPNDRWDQN